jgi:hypothetical protein
MSSVDTSTPPKKKKTNGKAKGNGFELTIAKLFSSTFAPLEFRRSQSSGAILGGQNHVFLHKFSNAAKALFVGDIVPTNEADVLKAEAWQFRFTIECKFYASQDSFSALFKNPQILSWWEQAKTDAAKIDNKKPLLICKFNYTDVYVGFECDPPSNVNRIIQIDNVKFCLLNEALKDLSWWKQNM